MVITSLENEKIKSLVKLQKKKYRDLDNKYLVEGEHLVIEADKAKVIEEIFVLENEDIKYDYKTTYVSYNVMKKLSTMDNPPKVIALCKKNNKNEIIKDKILLLDEIQDPGNLGTIIRSSLAFGVTTIILSEKSVDLYNQKVLRATQGMYNHINIISMNINDAINYMQNHNIPIYGTSVVNGVDASTLNSKEKEKYCLIMGNEGNGISKDILAMCDKNLYIKMNDKVESLNVAVACSILLYELGR